jgi:hypothetical protein
MEIWKSVSRFNGPSPRFRPAAASRPGPARTRARVPMVQWTRSTPCLAPPPCASPNRGAPSPACLAAWRPRTSGRGRWPSSDQPRLQSAVRAPIRSIPIPFAPLPPLLHFEATERELAAHRAPPVGVVPRQRAPIPRFLPHPAPRRSPSSRVHALVVFHARVWPLWANPPPPCAMAGHARRRGRSRSTSPRSPSSPFRTRLELALLLLAFPSPAVAGNDDGFA